MEVDHFIRSDLAGAAATARDLEALGFDGVYTAEAAHEPFFPLLLAAEHTSRIRVFTNIAVAFARSPMDLAMVSDDLQRLSGGRFVLGLGSQIRPHIEHRYSMAWDRPVARMGEMVGAIKAVHRTWNERVPLDFRGEIYQHTLMTPFFDPGPNPHGPPPVWVAALGPQMTAKAAEVGDGVLIHPFHSGKFVREHTAAAVAAGLARAGRSRAGFTVHATPIVCTGTTPEELERAAVGVRGLLAFYGSTPSYRVTLEAHGWGELQTELNAMTKQGQWDELASRVPDEVFEELAIHGTPDEIAGLVAERYGPTVDRIGLSMPYEATRETLEAIVAGMHALELQTTSPNRT
jgi:probable F420-dependent oxidoreductase